MRTFCKPGDTHTAFIIADLDPAYHAAVHALAFEKTPDDFAQSYPAETSNLDHIYDNFARHAEPLIVQKDGRRPVPWEQALEIVLHTIDGHSLDWWLVGSAALAARGLAITPGDIDLSVAGQDDFRLGDLLLEYLIETVAATYGAISSRFGRSFPFACVEWVGGVLDSFDEVEVTDVGPSAASRSATIIWRGHSIRVPPLDLQIQTNQRRRRTERVAKILAHLN